MKTGSLGLLELFPAYGRQYLSVEAVMQAWQEGKDFSGSRKGGPYTSCRETQHIVGLGYSGVVFRYGAELQFRSDPITF